MHLSIKLIINLHYIFIRYYFSSECLGSMLPDLLDWRNCTAVAALSRLRFKINLTNAGSIPRMHVDIDARYKALPWTRTLSSCFIRFSFDPGSFCYCLWVWAFLNFWSDISCWRTMKHEQVGEHVEFPQYLLESVGFCLCQFWAVLNCGIHACMRIAHHFTSVCHLIQLAVLKVIRHCFQWKYLQALLQMHCRNSKSFLLQRRWLIMTVYLQIRL